MLERIDESTVVVILSDHGAQGGHHPDRPTAGTHHEDGIYLFAGPSVNTRENGLGPTLTQVDVVRVILAQLDLPAAEDMTGRVPLELRPRTAAGSLLPLATSIPSYETSELGVSGAATLEDEVRQQLRSLGYVQ